MIKVIATVNVPPGIGLGQSIVTGQRQTLVFEIGPDKIKSFLDMVNELKVIADKLVLLG